MQNLVENRMSLNYKVEQLLNRQMKGWYLAAENYRALELVESRRVLVKEVPFEVQYNPARIHSSSANINPQVIQERPCFLCRHHLPVEQEALPYVARSGNEYLILCNPYPIFPQHLTIPDANHTEQLITGRIEDMLGLAEQLTDYVLLYNGPQSGASIPNHFHFQAGSKGFLPIQTFVDGGCSVARYPVPAFLFTSEAPASVAASFYRLITVLQKEIPQESEPMLNLLCWKSGACFYLVVYPRKRHRPYQFFVEGDAHILISPGVVDLGGVFITPLEKDFIKLTGSDIQDIISQISVDPNTCSQISNIISEPS